VGACLSISRFHGPLVSAFRLKVIAGSFHLDKS
jgi:hypothetical protein